VSNHFSARFSLKLTDMVEFFKSKTTPFLDEYHFILSWSVKTFLLHKFIFCFIDIFQFRLEIISNIDLKLYIIYAMRSN